MLQFIIARKVARGPLLASDSMPPASQFHRQLSTAALPFAVETVLTNASSSSHVIARAGICEPATDEKTGLAPARPEPAPTPSPAVAAAVARVLQASCRLGSLSGSSRGPCNGAGGEHHVTVVGSDGRCGVQRAARKACVALAVLGWEEMGYNASAYLSI